MYLIVNYLLLTQTAYASYCTYHNTFYNRVFFDVNFMVLLMFSRIHGTHLKFSNENKVI